MSAINTNPPATGFAPANAALDFERPATNALANAMIPSIRERSDQIRFGPLPPLGAVNTGGGFGEPIATDPQSGFSALMSSFVAAIANLFSQLGSLFNFANNPRAQAPQQNYYTNARASSLGDPHESFDGTTGSGKNVAGHWDSMTSHDNLLSSDSFAGGYRVSNAVTHPSAKGVTLNDHVTVATDGGQTNVTMNKDGSYDVRSYGRQVSLEQGRGVRLDNGETVTLNADKSLTVDDANGRGGSLETTLRANASGGVDAKGSAKNVDLGGYLVSKSDGDMDPVALGGNDYSTVAPVYSGGFEPASAPALTTFANVPLTAQPFDIKEA